MRGRGDVVKTPIVEVEMVKWLRAIEFAEDYRGIRDGECGWREDITHYEQAIPI